MVHYNHDRPGADDRVEVRTVCGDSESVTHTILRGLAAIKNVPVVELDPLYEQLETDALVTLLNHAQDSEGVVNVEFTLDEFTVVVTYEGDVYIHTGEPTVATISEGH